MMSSSNDFSGDCIGNPPHNLATYFCCLFNTALSPPSLLNCFVRVPSLDPFPLAFTAWKSSWYISLVSFAGLYPSRCFPSCLCSTSFHFGTSFPSERLSSKPRSFVFVPADPCPFVQPLSLHTETYVSSRISGTLAQHIPAWQTSWSLSLAAPLLPRSGSVGLLRTTDESIRYGHLARKSPDTSTKATAAS